MNRQFCREYAIELCESKWWEDLGAEEIVKVQLFQERLCVPFDIFHEAVERVFGRPVWTHEFAFVERPKEEYLGEREVPTFDEIVGLLPAEKTIVVMGGQDGRIVG
jgi:hypothetical protein